MGVKCMPKELCKKQPIDEDNNPRNAVDQEPKPKIDGPKLKAELEIANYEIQELDCSIHQIKENLKLAKRDLRILCQNLAILRRAREPLDHFMEDNKIAMKTLRRVLWRIGGSNTVARACSAEEQLHEVIRILDYRTTHETIHISEEKQIVQELKTLRKMRGKFIACDATRAEIWDEIANRDSIQLGDKEKLIRTEMDIVSRDLHLFNELSRQHRVGKKRIETFVKNWDAQLKDLKGKRDKADTNVQELKNKMETAGIVMKPNLKRKETTQEQKVFTNKVAMLKKEKQEEKRVAGEAIRAEREAEKQQKIREKREKRRASKKAEVNEVSSELVQQPSEAMEQQGQLVEQGQTRGQVSIPEILRETRAACVAVFLALVVVLIACCYLF